MEKAYKLKVEDSWLNKRKKLVYKKLTKTRISREQSIQSKFETYFFSRRTLNEQIEEEFEKEEDSGENQGKKTYSQVDLYSRRKPYKLRKKDGSSNPDITTKIIVQKFNAYIAVSSAI